MFNFSSYALVMIILSLVISFIVIFKVWTRYTEDMLRDATKKYETREEKLREEFANKEKYLRKANKDMQDSYNDKLLDLRINFIVRTQLAEKGLVPHSFKVLNKDIIFATGDIQATVEVFYTHNGDERIFSYRIELLVAKEFANCMQNLVNIIKESRK